MGNAGSDDLVGLDPGERFPTESDVAAARLDQAGDRPKRRALARAVRPDQRDDLALLDRDRDPFEGVDGSVMDVEIFQLEQAQGSSPR